MMLPLNIAGMFGLQQSSLPSNWKPHIGKFLFPMGAPFGPMMGIGDTKDYLKTGLLPMMMNKLGGK